MIVAVAGGKGGVGKSTVALNLAACLDAVLVDTDLTMADLPTTHGPDLHDVLAGRVGPVEAVRDGDVLDILPCGRTLQGAKNTDPTVLPEAVRAIAGAYGDVVLDTPSGMEADAGLPLLVAEASVLVTTSDRPAIVDTVRTRELARELDADLAQIVLNQAGSNPPTKRVRRTFGAPVTSIDRSSRLATAQAEGLPVACVAPNAPVTDQFEHLATVVQSIKS